MQGVGCEECEYILDSVSRTVEDTIRSLGGRIVHRCQKDRFIFTGVTKYTPRTASKIDFSYSAVPDFLAVVTFESHNVHMSVSMNLLEGYSVIELGRITTTGNLESYSHGVDIEIAFSNPFTGELEMFGLFELLELAEKLSLATWPGTDKSVVLKFGSSVKRVIDDDAIYLMDSTGKNLLGITFATKYGKLFEYDKRKALFKVGTDALEVYIDPRQLWEFSSNFRTAIEIFGRADLIREFNIVG